MQLDKYQELVVNSDPQANIKVIGAPGSGKTHTLVRRYVALHQQHNLKPSRILMLTYSRKAAKEMAKRISLSVDLSRQEKSNISTINAFCHRLYNDWRVGNGLKPLKIWEYGDKQTNPSFKASELMTEHLGLSDLSLFDFINKTLKLSPTPTPDLLEEIYMNASKAKMSYEMWREYETWMKHQNLTDFYGQVWNVDRLLHSKPIFAMMIGQRYDKIICDEMQDTSPQTYRILLKLAKQSSIEMFGDPSQSIYGFNGAAPYLFFEVEGLVSDMEVFHLANNYRSHNSIVEVVNNFGPNTTPRFNLMNCVKNKQVGHVVIKQVERVIDQGDYIASEIEKNGYRYGDIYVLSRTNSHCSVIYQRLLELGIPADYSGNFSIWDKTHMKAAIGYLAIANEQDGPDDLMNILNIPSEDYIGVFGPSTGKYTPTRFLARKYFTGKSFADLLTGTFEPSQAQRPGVGNIKKFIDRLKNLDDDRARADNIQAAISKWSQWTGKDCAGVEDDLSMLWDKLENLDYNVNSLRIYIQKMVKAKRRIKSDVNRVQIMTIHQAKGLEALIVFFTGLSEPASDQYRDSGFHPNRNTNPLVNEENCLYYTGISRAIMVLYLMCYSQSGRTTYDLSSFITPFTKEISKVKGEEA